jgi:hypothetical protein
MAMIRHDMNYNNSAVRLRNSPALQPAEDEMVYSVETDKRGTHLRVRKASTLLRRALRPAAIATPRDSRRAPMLHNF